MALASECFAYLQPQRIQRQAALDLSAVCERKRARLLRDDDCDGIGFFRYTDRGTMARAQILAEPRLHGQWQEAGGRGDTIVLNDYGAVMQRQVVVKNRDEQVVGQYCVQGDPAFNVASQTDISFNEDQ